MRTTKKEVESVFQMWLKANGFTEGHYQRMNDPRYDNTFTAVPGYILDHAPDYGGYRIAFLDKCSGERTPFGDNRHSSSQLVAMLRFSMDTVREQESAQE